jgi:hypothetical protein
MINWPYRKRRLPPAHSPRSQAFTSPGEGQRDSGHFRFLELPPEIRNLIYEEIHFVGQIYFPSKDAIGGWERCSWNYEKAQLALLRVCKQVHDEAEPLYLSKNLFLLPVKFFEY